ncbi:MAG: T9SS C-terminal target domain-containing protein, partial [Bacteroidetes bacterium]
NAGITHNINGLLMREPMCGSDPIHLVDVTMTGSATGNVNPANGSFSFTVPENAGVTITPTKNINWTNGVTVNDALLVHQHAGGFAPLGSPYKIIAADANKDNLITVFDASLIHQLSIGFIPSLPGNTSWRFVPANPPLAAPFPVPNEFLSYANVTADILDADFIGVKVGDVNCSANPVTGFASGVDERAEKLRFSIEDQQITAGQDVYVTFASQNFTNMSGYQMTVNFDTEVLQYVEAIPGNLVNMGGANFNPLRSSEGLLATNWYNLTPVDLPDGYEMFTLHFTAMQDAATLSDLISVSEDYIVIEAVKGDGELIGVGVTFENPTATGENLTDRFALYQNRPNPFAHKTVIGFHLPTGDDATLTLTDASGKTLKVVKGYYGAGYHQVIIDRDDLPTQGVVFYRLQTSTNSAVRKMILMD